MTERMTPVQLEVWRMLAQGMRNKEIARQLNCTDTRVAQHVSQVLKVLDVKTRLKAVVLYLNQEASTC